MAYCSECADVLQAALEASHAYHQLLDAMESAHLRNDIEEAFRQLAKLETVTLSRENAITELRLHQRIHAKVPLPKTRRPLETQSANI